MRLEGKAFKMYFCGPARGKWEKLLLANKTASSCCDKGHYHGGDTVFAVIKL